MRLQRWWMTWGILEPGEGRPGDGIQRLPGAVGDQMQVDGTEGHGGEDTVDSGG